MFRALLVAALALVCVASNAEARQRHKTYLAHPDCNILWPCAGVSSSPRGEMIAKQVGFGAAQKVYKPQAAKPVQQRIRTARHVQQPTQALRIKETVLNPQVVAHPDGCPRRLFCGCGAAERLKKVWGIIVEKPRELWLAANWYRYPRANPAPGMIAVRRHHVYVIEADLGGGKVLAYDANSGKGLTRVHVRSLAGYTVVNPRGGSA